MGYVDILDQEDYRRIAKTYLGHLEADRYLAACAKKYLPENPGFYVSLKWALSHHSTELNRKLRRGTYFDRHPERITDIRFQEYRKDRLGFVRRGVIEHQLKLIKEVEELVGIDHAKAFDYSKPGLISVAEVEKRYRQRGPSKTEAMLFLWADQEEALKIGNGQLPAPSTEAQPAKDEAVPPPILTRQYERYLCELLKIKENCREPTEEHYIAVGKLVPVKGGKRAGEASLPGTVKSNSCRYWDGSKNLQPDQLDRIVMAAGGEAAIGNKCLLGKLRDRLPK